MCPKTNRKLLKGFNKWMAQSNFISKRSLGIYGRTDCRGPTETMRRPMGCEWRLRVEIIQMIKDGILVFGDGMSMDRRGGISDVVGYHRAKAILPKGHRKCARYTAPINWFQKNPGFQGPVNQTGNTS